MSARNGQSDCAETAVRGRRPADATTIADILQSAKEEFAANGFDGARVDTICRGAHVSRQLLYYYFGSKSGLYSVILEEAARDTYALVSAARYDLLPPPMALSQFIKDIFRNHVERPQIVKMTIDEAQHNFVHVGKKSPLSAVLRMLIDEVLADILERGRASGDFRNDLDPDGVFWAIFSLVTTWFAHFPLVSLVSRAGEGKGKDVNVDTWCENSIRFVLASLSK